MDDALSLERHGPLGRFDARTETEYRRWLGLKIRPLGAMMSSASLIAWLVIPVVSHVALPAGADLSTIYAASWGINLPLLVGCLVYIWVSSTQQHFVLLGT